MPKSIAIAAAILVLGFAVASAPRAAEMTPGASIGGSAAAESDAARDEPAPSGPRAVGAGDSARKHVHPDSNNEVREASARNSLGGEGGGGSADIAPKSRHRGGAWQALLPGVMK